MKITQKKSKAQPKHVNESGLHKHTYPFSYLINRTAYKTFSSTGAPHHTKLKHLEKCEHLPAKIYINNCTHIFMMHPTEIINTKVLHIRRAKILHSSQPKNCWNYTYLFCPSKVRTKPMNLFYDKGLHGTLEFNEDTSITEANSPYLQWGTPPLLKQISHIYICDSFQPLKTISSTQYLTVF